MKSSSGTTDIYEPIILPSNTSFIGCVLYTPQDPDRNEIHNWKAKVQANFIFEECIDCKKIRNKKKLVN